MNETGAAVAVAQTADYDAPHDPMAQQPDPTPASAAGAEEAQEQTDPQLQALAAAADPARQEMTVSDASVTEQPVDAQADTVAGASDATYDGEGHDAVRLSDAPARKSIQSTSTSVLPALVAQTTYEANAQRYSTATGYLRQVWVDNKSSTASDSGTGTSSVPFRTIGAAMAQLRPGDDVIIKPGTYREQVVVPSRSWGSNITRIRAYTARSVTIKGSVPVASWTSAGNNVYYTTWSGDQPQQVFRAGKLLKQIGGTVWGGYPTASNHELNGLHASEGGVWPGRTSGGVAQLVADSFTWDAGAKRIYVKLAAPRASGEALEVSNRRHVLQIESANNLTVEGLDFAHSNTTSTYRQGAVKLAGTNSQLRNVKISQMDGSCLQLLGTAVTLRDSTVESCGQVGITGHGTRISVIGNRITSNNTRGFNKWWEAGGVKFIGGSNSTTWSTFRENVVSMNNGDGIWLDTRAANITIAGNVTSYNVGFGIHYEASSQAIIQGNWAYGNTARGIHVLESKSNLIKDNSIFSNKYEGLAIVDGIRTWDATLRPYGNSVQGNLIAWNDFRRNYIQMVLPGRTFTPASNRNTFRSESAGPRLSMGYMAWNNYPYEKLSWWQSGTGLDLQSAAATEAVPAVITTALAAKRLLTQGEVPAVVLGAGTQ